ncbi:MAG TPA: hypothetical protein VEC56_12435 [Candidatus Krumholzibacteria bacterium]|nr:hypothetical protein [Candidatus Krumholzibacteria bacterium]
MRPRYSIAIPLTVALACLLACDDDPIAPSPPEASEPQWSEWRELPPSFTVYSMWAVGPNNVFAVGPAGTAARWNGVRWTSVPVDLFRNVWSVTGTPDGSVVAVGDGGATYSFNGIAFAPTPQVTAEDLRSVWAASDDTLLAVGELGTLLVGNGSTWSLAPPPVRASMLSVWGTSMRDVFVVGPDGLIIHFDGNAWSEQSSGTLETLASVSGTASNDVYAVGTSGTILHYDGADWSPMTSPTGSVLQCVVAGAGDPIAVGANGVALLLQDGAWSRVEVGTTHWLYAACRAGTHTWVGGSRVVRVHDGTAWRSEATGAVPILRGVGADPSGSAIVVGDDGYIARGRGDGWEVDEGVDARDLYCVYLTSGGELFAGGVQRLLRFDGTEWVVEIDDIITWYGFAESPTELYAVGSNGTLRRRSGGGWTTEIMPRFTESLNAVACLSGSEAYAVGDRGVVLRYDGIGWTQLNSRSLVDIRDVIEAPGDDLNRRALAIGESGALFVLNTQGVTALESPTSANLYALARDPAGDILAFGGGASMLRYRDGTWSSDDSPVLQPLYAAHSGETEVFVVGGGVSGGLVLRYGPP